MPRLVCLPSIGNSFTSVFNILFLAVSTSLVFREKTSVLLFLVYYIIKLISFVAINMCNNDIYTYLADRVKPKTKTSEEIEIDLLRNRTWINFNFNLKTFGVKVIDR